jgi:hypothetical protein
MYASFANKELIQLAVELSRRNSFSTLFIWQYAGKSQLIPVAIAQFVSRFFFQYMRKGCEEISAPFTASTGKSLAEP